MTRPQSAISCQSKNRRDYTYPKPKPIKVNNVFFRQEDKRTVLNSAKALLRKNISVINVMATKISKKYMNQCLNCSAPLIAQLVLRPMEAACLVITHDGGDDGCYRMSIHNTSGKRSLEWNVPAPRPVVQLTLSPPIKLQTLIYHNMLLSPYLGAKNMMILNAPRITAPPHTCV